MAEFCNDVSALGRGWSLRVPKAASVPAEVFRNGNPVPEILNVIAARRGVPDTASWLEPSLKAFMPDPSALVGMDAAVAFLCDAVEAGKQIGILGDYDVDGATSSATLSRWIVATGAPRPIIHIPDRLAEGYGPNIPAIERLRSQGVELLIIADSGTRSFPQVARAREIGLDVVILDHHEPEAGGPLPDGIVVNPKRLDCDGSLSYLCTAGLAFLFLVGANRELRNRGFFSGRGIAEPKLQLLLGMTALGTVADMVPLVGLNRAYVSLGLALMPEIMGLRALLEAINKGREGTQREVGYTAVACGFNIGPCINAAGRIDDTMLGVRLLTSDSAEECEAISARLVELNKQRQEMQKEMIGQCIEMLEGSPQDDPVLVAYREDWHPGVVGLGASKVKDHFDKSAVVIGAGGKGSARSIEGFNIGQALGLAQARGVIVKGGGHAAAGGLTVDPSRLDDLRALLREAATGIERPPTRVDIALEVGEAEAEMVKAFEFCAPFGMGNSRPRVVIRGGELRNVRLLKEKHVKAEIRDGRSRVDLILFNGVGSKLGDAIRASEGHMVDVLGELAINEYGGRVYVQIKPEDIMVGAAVSAEAAAA